MNVSRRHFLAALGTASVVPGRAAAQPRLSNDLRDWQIRLSQQQARIRTLYAAGSARCTYIHPGIDDPDSFRLYKEGDVTIAIQHPHYRVVHRGAGYTATEELINGRYRSYVQADGIELLDKEGVAPGARHTSQRALDRLVPRVRAIYPEHTVRLQSDGSMVIAYKANSAVISPALVAMVRLIRADRRGNPAEDVSFSGHVSLDGVQIATRKVHTYLRADGSPNAVLELTLSGLQVNGDIPRGAMDV